jgi:hypothetical protein
MLLCRDHKYAPGAIVCRHLVEGSSHAWVQLPAQNGEEMDDWLCRECFLKGPSHLSVDDLLYICIHCVRDLRRRSKPKQRRRK